jgi:hypothetical protein
MSFIPNDPFTTISWTTPTYDGGTPILQYRVVSDSGGYDSGNLLPTVRSVTPTGLSTTSQCRFLLTVTNNAGLTDTSSIDYFLPNYVNPLWTQGLLSATGTWSDPPPGRPPIIKYAYRRSIINNNDDTWTEFGDGTTRSVVVPFPVDSYSTVYIRARNAVGWGFEGGSSVLFNFSRPSEYINPALSNVRVSTPSVNGSIVTFTATVDFGVWWYFNPPVSFVKAYFSFTNSSGVIAYQNFTNTTYSGDWDSELTYSGTGYTKYNGVFTYIRTYIVLSNQYGGERTYQYP